MRMFGVRVLTGVLPKVSAVGVQPWGITPDLKRPRTDPGALTTVAGQLKPHSTRGLQLCADSAQRGSAIFPQLVGPDATSGSAVDRDPTPLGHDPPLALSLNRTDSHLPNVRRLLHLSRTFSVSLFQETIPAPPRARDRTGPTSPTLRSEMPPKIFFVNHDVLEMRATLRDCDVDRPRRPTPQRGPVLLPDPLQSPRRLAWYSTAS